MFGLLSIILAVHSTSAFFDLQSIFNIDVLPAKVPLCNWDATTVPEQTPRGIDGICFKDTPYYDQQQINDALNKDPSAKFFYDTVIKMYQPMNETYFGSSNKYTYKDMCQVRPELVVRVNSIDKNGVVENCNIVNPYEQNIYMARCGTNCMYGSKTAPNNYCVPDGYVKRYALAFCPGYIVKQCRAVLINIPVGCSCKRYTCLKY
ncbi:hypothetical protein SNE40_018839 [Patella caerulea]